MPYQDPVTDFRFGSYEFQRSKLEGLIEYVCEQYRLADNNNVSGYINREMYRRSLFDERFELKAVSKNANLLYDVAVKEGCQTIYTTWYKEVSREYRVLSIGSLYGISLLEYINLPEYIQDVLIEDAKTVKQKEPKEADAMLKAMEKSNSLFNSDQLNKLR